MGALVFATQDHKPDVIAEQARIQTAGGEVRSEIYELQGLSRNMQLTNIGRPHCKAPTEVALARKPFMLLGSDGICEFIDSDFM